MPEDGTVHLELRGVSGGYNASDVVKAINMRVPQGTIVAILGANGAGKTTLLRVIAGLCRTHAGSVLLEGRRIEKLRVPARVLQGMTLVPQGHELFGGLSVRENLLLGAYVCHRRISVDDRLKDVFSLFPVLQQRQQQIAQSLSGGERAMVSLGRAMMTSSRLLLLDEPSLGLAPRTRADLFTTLASYCERQGLTILVAEQDVPNAFRVSSHIYVLQGGRVVIDAPPSRISQEMLRNAYLGSLTVTALGADAG